MKTMLRALSIALLAAGALPAYAGDIVRCVSAGGAVTYQQIQCPEAAREQATGITNDYPPVNMAERERLLAREADMYRRLEAERDRLMQESMLREARAERTARQREAETLAAAEAQPYLVAWPIGPVRPTPHRRIARPGNQPVWTGGNPLVNGPLR
jgi:hypothetical protein